MCRAFGRSKLFGFISLGLVCGLWKAMKITVYIVYVTSVVASASKTCDLHRQIDSLSVFLFEITRKIFMISCITFALTRLAKYFYESN